MNSFSVDKNAERRNMISKVIKEIDPSKSGGASSERYFFNGKVYKVPASEKSLFKAEEVERNIKLLENSKVDFADTILGVYNLSDVGYGSETPVVIQEQADLTFRGSLKAGEATENTRKLFDRAIDVADNAIESELVLDGSLTNYGMYGNRVLFLDVQDGNSVEKYTVEEFEDMYESLANSMSRACVEKKRSLKEIDKRSKFFTM